MSQSISSLSIVIPVYNGALTLSPLLAQLQVTMDELRLPFEVLLVNDGSSDASWSVIQSLAQQYAGVQGINLMRNYGQHNALLCGIRAAKNEVIVTMDDDLQHSPAYIPVLLDKLAAGDELVYGAPLEEQHGFFRNAASVMTKIALSSVMNARSARHVSAFRAFYTDLRQAFANYQGPTVSLDVLLTWGTSKIGYVLIPHSKRESGSSHYTFRKLVAHAMNLITGFTAIPLRLAIGLGFFFLLFGILILLYVVIRFFMQGGIVPGFTFLASIIVIFSGVQLFSLGIIGEYLARMHFRLMDKPAYIIKKGDHDSISRLG
jgi:undecaprenyl-phosphate 4-deoxy-4-formamido-L-arabinose transferase